MRRRRHIGLVLATVILLTGCNAPNDQPGAVSGDEAHQLNDAAAMLDANSVSADAVANAKEPTP